MEKLTERLDTRGIRVTLSTRAKLNVVQQLCAGRLTQAQVLREAIERGVDHLFAEYGKEGIARLCREMLLLEDLGAGARPVSVSAGGREEMSEEKAS